MRKEDTRKESGSSQIKFFLFLILSELMSLDSSWCSLLLERESVSVHKLGPRSPNRLLHLIFDFLLATAV